jgi:hypothetical protein
MPDLFFDAYMTWREPRPLPDFSDTLQILEREKHLDFLALKINLEISPILRPP